VAEDHVLEQLTVLLLGGTIDAQQHVTEIGEDGDLFALNVGSKS
jgi:hypothetical protein